MKRIALAFCGIALAACASTPRGPSDEEVRATLDANVQQLVNAILAADAATTVSHFAPDGRLILTNVLGPEGVLNVDLAGADRIGAFLQQVGAPPDFTMDVRGFSRSGDRAQQTGSWVLAGEQTGTFVFDWTRMPDGAWRITRWQFDGNAP